MSRDTSQVQTYQLTLFSIELIFLITAFIMSFNAIMYGIILFTSSVSSFISFHFISFHHLTTVLSHIFKKTEPTWRITCTCLGNSIPGQSKWEKKNLRQESIKSIKGNALLCWILLDNELWRDSMCTELAIQVDSGLTVERSHALQQSIRWKKKKKLPVWFLLVFYLTLTKVHFLYYACVVAFYLNLEVVQMC